jgi:NAD(P)-dependent dehydrogenase (short-subunit alcohol dehydrogenase family)
VDLDRLSLNPSSNLPMNDTSRTRVAFVTGGAKGIGAEVCARLSALGHQVLVADLDLEAATGTAQALQAAGGQASAIGLDVGKPESIAAAFAQVEREHGRCDILVNSAGIAKVFPFLDFPLDNFVATMNVNVTGTLLCAQAAARLMAKQGWGRIVNIASVAGMRAVGSGRTAYGTSKGAVIALTRQMAVELAQHGITANAVAPGPVDTPMTQALHTAQFRAEYAKAIPMNRYGTCGEIASAVVYLVSDDARYVTGIAMPVDGGFLASGARGL